MLTLSILTIKIYLLTWFFTNFEPLQNKIDDLFIYIEESNDNKIKLLIADNIHILLGCHKCLTLWITLSITFDPIIAIASSYVANLLEKN